MNKTTAIVFFGILVVGLVISGIFLANRFGEPVEVTDAGEADPIVETGDAPEETPKDDSPEPKPASDPQPDPEADPKPSGKKETGKQGDSDTKKPADSKKPADPEAVADEPSFSSPEAAMQALADKAGKGDYEAFLGLVGEDAVPESIRGRLKRRIEDPSYSLDEASPITELSKSADSVRWALNFTSGEGEEGEELYVDLDVSQEEAVDFAKLSFPLELASGTKKKKDTAPDGSKPSSPGDPDAKPAGKEKEKMEIDVEALEDADALTIAQTFSRAVVRRNFSVARQLADPETVTDERVAALMIAIEEGDFALEEKRPFVVTLSRDDITWVLTRVKSESMGSEFALELGRVADSWKVSGLTFSKVLSALADRGGGGDVAYSPIVEDPGGGDSLVLYFEFDDAEVTSRANRQLKIVADILEENSDRVIRINGHADALGTDAYNRTLSDRRAESIREALIALGVSPDQVITEAFGETKPRRPNFKPDGTDNPTGRSQNRRAEVYLDF